MNVLRDIGLLLLGLWLVWIVTIAIVMAADYLRKPRIWVWYEPLVMFLFFAPMPLLAPFLWARKAWLRHKTQHQRCFHGYGMHTIDGIQVYVASDGLVSCDCDQFLHPESAEDRPCRHVKEAEARICGWEEGNGEAQTPEQKKDHICPRCGGPTKMVWHNPVWRQLAEEEGMTNA